MKYVKAIFVCLFVLLIFILAVQNYQDLTAPIKFRINLGVFNYETAGMPLVSISVFTFVIGVLASGLYGIAELLRLKKQVKVLTREVKEKDNELNTLRNLPITAEDVSSEEVSSEE